MSGKRQVAEAEGIALRFFEDMGDISLSLPMLTRLVRRFSEVEFEVPEVPDSDGYLFQYGEANWFPERTFALGLVRQLEIVNPAGEHEAYAQVQFELTYPVDGELDSAGDHSEWFFPDPEASLDAWFDRVNRDPISGLLIARRPRKFEIWQELV